jgi:serine/threonine protein kinase
MINGNLLQQKIQGLNVYEAIIGESSKGIWTADSTNTPYGNIADFGPKTQGLQYALELALAVNAMHNHRDANGNLAPIVHNDIKTPNMMLEKQENSHFRLRLIDFGGATREGESTEISSYNTAPECLLQPPNSLLAKLSETKTSKDIYSIAVELPLILFGLDAEYKLSDPSTKHLGKLIGKEVDEEGQSIIGFHPSDFAIRYLEMAIEKLKSNASLGSQYADWLKRANSLTAELNQKKAELKEVKNALYDNKDLDPDKTEKLRAKMNSLKILETEQKTSTKELYALLEQDTNGQKEVQKAMRKEIWEDLEPAISFSFNQLANKCYPDDISQRLAYMIADCMSPYPGARPTIEHIILALQNMRFADWDGDGPHQLQGAEPTTPEEIEIQSAFSWITRAE